MPLLCFAEREMFNVTRTKLPTALLSIRLASVNCLPAKLTGGAAVTNGSGRIYMKWRSALKSNFELGE